MPHWHEATSTSILSNARADGMSLALGLRQYRAYRQWLCALITMCSGLHTHHRAWEQTALEARKVLSDCLRRAGRPAIPGNRRTACQVVVQNKQEGDVASVTVPAAGCAWFKTDDGFQPSHPIQTHRPRTGPAYGAAPHRSSRPHDAESA
jgi:hypothetical protein